MIQEIKKKKPVLLFIQETVLLFTEEMYPPKSYDASYVFTLGCFLGPPLS